MTLNPFAVLAATATGLLFLTSLLLTARARRSEAVDRLSAKVPHDGAPASGEAHFRRLYDANVIGIAFWTSNGLVEKANGEVVRIFGIAPGELPGWRWGAHNTPQGELADAQAMEELRATGRATPYEKECVRADGTRFWVQVKTERIDDQRLISFLTDVTERVEGRQALQKAHDILAERVAMLEGVEATGLAHERAQVEVLATRLDAAIEELETFSYSVSHDLRAPLRAIDGFSRELLLSADSLDETGKRYLGRIRAATQRMSSLIDDLLALTRLSRRPMKVERVDVTLLAEEVAAELGAGHVAVQRGLVARADPHLLRVVLQNLIGNAVKFSGRRGEPRVEVLAAAGGALAVRDNGVGFDMQYAGKMFEPFQRLHPSSQFEGTGIGLAIVKRLIRRHGGTVRAESAPDQGASFYFTLGEQR
jgi:PAS domain S-box-containing protein